MSQLPEVSDRSFVARMPVLNHVVIAGFIASVEVLRTTDRTLFVVRMTNGNPSRKPIEIACTCSGSVAHRLLASTCVGAPVIVSGSLSNASSEAQLHVRVAALQFLERS